MKTHIFYSFLFVLLWASCSSSSDEIDSTSPPNTPGNQNGDTNTPEWLIPLSEVKDGGPGKDGIPSIDNPKFITASSNTYVNNEDLVIGAIVDGEAKAYPHKVLDWHEIVNDNSTSVSYCPLTGTAFAWSSYVSENKTTFGVSGLLYNTNLILYDRITESYWSQLGLECVNGSLIGHKPTLINIVETNWETWQALYSNTKVLSLETGFDRDYNLYPYGDYKTNHSRFLFTASPSNNALPNKQRVFAIIDGNKSKVYQFSDFNNGNVVADTFNGKTFIIVGNKHLINAFEIDATISNRTFEYDLNHMENTFFKDNLGNNYSVFGTIVSGPNTGTFLKPPASVVSFWFAIAAFYPNPEIYTKT